MTLKRASLLLVSLALAAWLGVGLAWSAEFSATMVTRMQGQEHKGKVYVSGEKMRQETSTPGGKNITISRLDKKVMWMVMPEQKMYMEMKVKPSDLGKTMAVSKEQQAKMKRLGTETVNGYETDKYETTVKTGQGGTVKQYMWISKKLGVPIKIADQKGAFTMEYLDIKEGDVPANLFEVPQGYQKMRMPPGMPQGMPQRQ